MRLSRSIVGEQEAEAVRRVLVEDGFLGMGREVQAFERELASFLGVSTTEVACVSSGTAALHLAVAAVCEPGDEVLVQSLSFLASFQAISGAGAVPVACEVLPETFTIDLADAEVRITQRTRAVMPVHYASNPGSLDAVYAFAEQQGLRVIEDAAQAFGCTHAGRLVGSFGDVRCFSFDGIKNITSGEGGLVVSGDQTVMDCVRNGRLLGVERDTEQRYQGGRSWVFDVHRQGYRYHMSNLFAAVGRVQLRRFRQEFAPARTHLASHYRSRLKGEEGLRLLEADLNAVVPHIQPVRVLNGKRDAVQDALKMRGIESGIHYKPNHLLTFYRSDQLHLPVTERLYGEVLSMPLHPGLNETDVDRVCDTVLDAIG
ncbi:MAG: DegT/DnrJ/EryC1/StrS family aminotransferase [Candidatus Binatia bacterium]